MSNIQQNNPIIPNWPAPKQVKAITTTRLEGDLALPVDRLKLIEHLHLPAPPVWLNQVHGTNVISLEEAHDATPTADAAYCRTANHVCAVLTADCLPILITDRHGQEIAAIHAGWRGLAAGVIDRTLSFFSAESNDLFVWLGPAIGPQVFEVGEEVRQTFLQRHPDYQKGFIPHKDRWRADIYRLAKINLDHLNVQHIYGGDFCTYQNETLFYSYRRDKGRTGRMATLIWRQP